MGTFELVTLALVGLTGWVIVARFTARSDSSWPLFYYLLVVAYQKGFEGSLNPYWVYVGVVSALFLRFEFLSGPYLRVIKIVEISFLCYVVYRCLTLGFGR